MKNGRINERNSGKWSLGCEPKTRNANLKKQDDLTAIQQKAQIHWK